MRSVRVVLSGIVLLLSVVTARAQVPGDTTTTLPEVRIEATRSTGTQIEAPLSLSIETRDVDRRLTEAPSSLADVLPTVPGLWISERGHFAENERISVRGMGWRASFGVRGVQVVLDGIPLTMPDGQAVTEVIDPAFVERVEVLRGPGSLFWGNGSGGVLHFTTQRGVEPGAMLRVSGSSYGGRYYAGAATLGGPDRRVNLFFSDQEREGYRSYSSGNRRRGALTSNITFGPRTRVNIMGAFVDQRGDSPGSLTLAQYEDNPRMANARNVSTRSGKTSFQGQAGATLTHQTQAGVFSVTVYGLRRTLDNTLPYEVYIPLERGAYGSRISYQQTSPLLDWSTGLDLGVMEDQRQNWNTVNGSRGDQLLLDQNENVQSVAAYGLLTLRPLPDLSLTAGLRADRIRFALTDKLLSNGDQSGDRVFVALSPGVGASWHTGFTTIYTSLSTSFETPTTTELVNRPDLTGGFNEDLKPQRVMGLEAGLRGTLARDLAYDLALFHLNVRDQLEQFQTEQGGDRDFFRNGGDNVHRGFEAALAWKPASVLNLSAAYTFAAYRFEGREVDGNHVPGIPAHRAVLAADSRFKRVHLRLTGDLASSQYVNDQNTDEAAGYALVDASLGITGLRVGPIQWYPFVEAQNLFDRRYVGSVNINASGNRFYEPGTGRTLTIGLSARF